MDILTPNWNDVAEKETVNGVNIYRFKTHSIYRQNAIKRTIDYINAASRLGKYDVYHGFAYLAPTVAGVFLSKMKKAKSVTNVFIRDSLEGNLKNPLLYSLAFKILKRTDYVLNIFWSVEKYYREKGVFGKKPMLTIPSWVESSFKSTENKVGREKIVLFAGRLVEEKGIYVLLDAFAKIKNKEKNARLVFVGIPSEKEKVEKKIRELGIEKQTEIIGFVSDKALGEWYRKSYAFAAPTLLNDGLTWTVIEAMASGKPVITTQVFELPIKTGDFQIVVEKGNSEELAEAALKLFSDKDFYDKCCKNAREIAKKLFDKKAIMEKYVGVYDSLFQQH